MPIDLSDATRQRLDALFAPENRGEAARLLRERCGEGLPLVHGTTPEAYDRLRFAALRISEGSLEGLRRAIDLANVDWRDLLVAAGFAEDIHAHEKWWPE